MRKMSSMVLGQLVQDGIADIYLISQQGKLILLTDEVDISESRLIGQGCQGKVYAVIVVVKDNDDEEKRLCALKELGEKNDAFPFSQHAKITADDCSSSANRIIKLMAIIEKKSLDEDRIQKYALLPFCGLFLNEITKKLPEQSKLNPRIEPIVILHATIDLLIAIGSIHAKGFVHGDIKGENVAYYNGHFCLIDLDCALKINQTVSAFAGSPLFVHPACFVSSNFCARAENDIYALGIVLKLLLNDRKTAGWMRKWEILGKEFGGLSVINKIDREQSNRWKAHNDKLTRNALLPSLTEELTQQQSPLEKLKCIANRMASINPANQPSVEELLFCSEQIRQSLLSSYNELGILDAEEAELRHFYEALIPTKFLLMLDKDINTPIKKEHKSKVSFFSLESSIRSRSSLESSTKSELCLGT